MENLPFTVERVGDQLVISAKPKKSLNKHQRRAFEKNKGVVKVELFDQAYFDRFDKIQVDLKEKFSFSAFFRTISNKIYRFVMK
jgi:hypothetical protein